MYKLRARQGAKYTGTGKATKWVLWASFLSVAEAEEYFDKVRKERPTWDVEMYEGRMVR